MQERALGALIIGGVALLGVAWAGIEGGIVGGSAVNGEKNLEKQLYTLVKDYDSSVTSLDARVSNCYSKETIVKEWVESWQDYDDVSKIVVFDRIYGYTDKNELFYVELQTTSGRPQDFEIKRIFTVNPEDLEDHLKSDEFNDSLKKQIVSNHAATASTFLYELCKEKDVKVVTYKVGDKTIVYTEYDDEGNPTTYVNGVAQQ